MRGRLEQLLRDEGAGAGAEAGAGMRARADVPEPVDKRAVPRLRANGRQRKFWSSASEPLYGSPWTRFGFAAWRSAGERVVRPRIDDSRFGTCLAIRAWMRSA